MIGAAVVVAASESGSRNVFFPVLGAALCLAIRLGGIYFDLSVPRPRGHDHDTG